MKMLDEDSSCSARPTTANGFYSPCQFTVATASLLRRYLLTAFSAKLHPYSTMTCVALRAERFIQPRYNRHSHELPLRQNPRSWIIRGRLCYLRSRAGCRGGEVSNVHAGQVASCWLVANQRNTVVPRIRGAGCLYQVSCRNCRLAAANSDVQRRPPSI